MKLRTHEAWMPAREYSRSLRGLTINLVVRDVEGALRFHREVLGTKVVYADPDFAVVAGYGAEWMMHADHTYEGHALERLFRGESRRGAGVELRLHGCDPDVAQAAAERLGYEVLAASTDKAHGLREAHLVDRDGCVWVPDMPVRRQETHPAELQADGRPASADATRGARSATDAEDRLRP